jgi:methylated-DNA-[protein]-cysteine S-methyltransferase
MTTDIIFAKPLDCYVEIEYGEKLQAVRFVKSGALLKEKKTFNVTFELERYFQGKQIDFSCAVDMHNLSPFVQKVLEEARKIEYGRTITYAELARNIGSKGEARAAGRALAKNPIPIIIPCHRVVAKHGIGGYSVGVDIKTRLLELEKSKPNNL